MYTHNTCVHEVSYDSQICAFSQKPNQISLNIAKHFFMYFFILLVKIPSTCQNFSGTRILSSLLSWHASSGVNFDLEPNKILVHRIQDVTITYRMFFGGRQKKMVFLQPFFIHVYVCTNISECLIYLNIPECHLLPTHPTDKCMIQGNMKPI